MRDTEEPFRAAVWQALQKRTEVLERQVVEMYSRGLSTQDIEDALTEWSLRQTQPFLSRSSVSRVTEVLWEEYEAFGQRDLSGYDVVYLFADAVYESPRQQAGLKEGILVTWRSWRTAAKFYSIWGQQRKSLLSLLASSSAASAFSPTAIVSCLIPSWLNTCPP